MSGEPTPVAPRVCLSDFDRLQRLFLAVHDAASPRVDRILNRSLARAGNGISACSAPTKDDPKPHASRADLLHAIPTFARRVFPLLRPDFALCLSRISPSALPHPKRLNVSVTGAVPRSNLTRTTTRSSFCKSRMRPGLCLRFCSTTPGTKPVRFSA